jgi:multiple sugar transport system substrate-binding protein
MSRRSFVAGGLGLVGGSLLAGCGGSGGSAAGDEITFLNWEPVEGTPLGRAIQAFEKKTGTKVTVQPAVTGDAYDTKMRTLLAGGSPPDVMRINDDFVRGFSEKGALLDLTRYIEQDKIDTGQFAKEAFEFPRQPDGTHTAWVLGYQPRLIFYNKDMFKEANVPLPPTEWTSEGWTWDDFLDRAKRLTIPGKRWGALIYLDTGYEQTFTINHGSRTGIYSEDGKRFTLADPTEVEALQWATDLTCREKVQPPWSELQQDNADTQLFAQGRLAMFFAAFGTVPYLRSTIKDFEWDVAPPPGDVEQRTEASVIVFTIPKAAKNPDKAWELLKFLSSEEGGRILAEGGAFTPINNKAAALLEPGDQPPANIGLFAEAARHLTAPNQTKNTLGARQLYRPALDAAYNCERPVGEVLAEIRPQVESALQG